MVSSYGRSSRSDSHFWQRAVVDEILAACDGHHGACLRMLGETGMRVGELKFLTWEDVDFQRPVILIRAKDGWKPKTGDDRVIPMFPAVRAVLEMLPRKSRWVVTAAPSKKYPDGAHQISERRLLQYLKRILKRLKLSGHLHTFRHSFISHALLNSVPEIIVREWVGHIDRETIKMYTHVAGDSSMAAMQRLAEINQSLQQPEVNNDQADDESK